MGNKRHAVDARDIDVLANAVEWSATVFLGRGRYDTSHFSTLEAAQARAATLKAVYPSKRLMIYGVNAAGRSAMLTPNLEQMMNAKVQPAAAGPKVYAKKFNAQRAARAAGHADDAVMVFAVDGGFTWSLKPAEATQQAQAATRVAVKRAVRQTAPTLELEQKEVIGITEAALAEHPIAQENAASWPSGPKKRSAPADAAKRGTLPPKPDFSAPTHARFRAKLEQVAAMVEAGDIAGLKAFEIKPASTSPKAIARYRDLAVMALEARA